MLCATLIAIGVWWTSNTIAHHAIHRPPFQSRSLNRLHAALLSALTGVPQAAWRDRHLAHHAGRPLRVRLTGELAVEIAVVAAVWFAMADRAPMFFAAAYLPGYAAGLMLCAVHGHYEHAGGATSYYGRVYNLLLFNDGYHVEHHMFPSVHWRELPNRRTGTMRASAWPAPLRWIELVGLERLESLVLQSPLLQRFVLRTHERAFRRLLPLPLTSVPADDLRPSPRPPSPSAGTEVSGGDGGRPRICIVGGGLFPRTALVLRALFPHASLTVIDANRHHIDIARQFLPADVECRHEMFDGSDTPYDVLVLPLSFNGSRDKIYAHPAAPIVIAHDWLWKKRGRSAVVSLALLKRINLVHR